MGSGFDKAQELNLENEPNARSHEMENLRGLSVWLPRKCEIREITEIYFRDERTNLNGK